MRKFAEILAPWLLVALLLGAWEAACRALAVPSCCRRPAR
jgi:ABC-type nitrate/sulfonate/bicarbonate transport system permease component